VILSIVKSAAAAIAFAVVVVLLWRAFERRGQPGWAVLVPLYNLFVLVRAAGRPTWWFALTLVPALNVAVVAWLLVDLARGREPAAGRRS